MDDSNYFLRTARMYLRRFQMEDAAALFDLDSDPEVMRFVSTECPTPMARIRTDILPRFLAYYEQLPPRGFWAAHLRDTRQFIGWFHLRPDKITPDEMELGYRLCRSAWGKGLATEGARALVDKAFNEWGYPKISARALAANFASRRVMEKAGFSFEENFIYGTEVIPGRSEEERRAVKYSLVLRRPAR
jgi:RimJ/RimL family protein N-acetyltransferase